jgi:hypothetical protein
MPKTTRSTEPRGGGEPVSTGTDGPVASLDLVRVALDPLGDAVRQFAEDFWEDIQDGRAFEVPLDGQKIPRELILALFQAPLLSDPDFIFREDFTGFVERFAGEPVVRFGATESDANGSRPRVRVFAGATPVGETLVGGFLEYLPDAAHAWVIWRLGVDPNRIARLLQQQLQEAR